MIFCRSESDTGKQGEDKNWKVTSRKILQEMHQDD